MTDATIPAELAESPVGRRLALFIDRLRGGAETLTDEDGRTSIPEVFAIGDGARFGGAVAAQAQGLVAAAAITRDLARPAPQIDAARQSLQRLAERRLWKQRW